jgi:hypothetical protein
MMASPRLLCFMKSLSTAYNVLVMLLTIYDFDPLSLSLWCACRIDSMNMHPLMFMLGLRCFALVGMTVNGFVSCGMVKCFLSSWSTFGSIQLNIEYIYDFP